MPGELIGNEREMGVESAACWSQELQRAAPSDVLQWAIATFGDRLGLASSFGGVSGMALLDMAVKIKPELRVFYVDTDFLFPETYATRDKAMRRYGITPLGYRPKLTPGEQAAQYGDRLWERDPDLCCALRKVEPNQRALEGLDAWVAGLRRDQSATRARVQPVMWDAKFNLFKICPLWNWTEEQVWDYIGRERVPVNPLHLDGYPSLGCTHCTRRVAPGEDLRAGRWSGSEKTECGLHK
ncbi:MAG: phosphoadenylyl-sulfate reductase [Cytophagales bacterium]|nr:phosphoadenylyl-sulfate reductase [Armatimonadota bacterium]